MTDYHVRPVNGDDSNGGTGPDNAWKSFFGPASGGQGGTYNCAQVTDGDRVFLWAEGVTAGEYLDGYEFDWYWPLKNGNVSLIGLNESGIEDETRYVVYLNAGWSSGFGINRSGGSDFSAYYPELTNIYEGEANYILILKNIRWTETKTLDPTQGSSNGVIYVGSYMKSSRPVLINCEVGPMTTSVGSRGFPYHGRHGGDITCIGCHFHDAPNTSGSTILADVHMIGCLVENMASGIKIQMYGGGPVILNNVFRNNVGSGVIILDEAAGGENSFGLIANNVFYNNDGYCIQTEDDQSISKIHIYNNVFDSNGSVIDLNSITHTYASAGGSRNIFLNNTNNIINSGSDTIEDFLTVGYGAGGSGGVGTTFGSNNIFSGVINYGSTGGTGDYRIQSSSTVDQLGYLQTTAGLGLGPDVAVDTGGVTGEFDSSLSLNSTVTFGSGKRFRLAQKTGIPVWRRV